MQARSWGRWTDFSAADLASATPQDPAAPRATASPAGDGEALIEWGAVDGAERYAVAEVMPGGSYRNLDLGVSGTSYLASGLANGVEHRFLVQALVGGRWSSASDGYVVSVTPVGAMKPSPVLVAGDKSISLSWEHVSGADRYAVWCSYNGGRTYYLDKNQTSLNLTGLQNGTTYRFCVRALIDGSYSSVEDRDYLEATPYSLYSPRVKVDGIDDGSVSLSWDAVEGASRYAVAYRSGNGYVTLSYDVQGLSFVATGLENGKTYLFLVQAYVGGHWSTFSQKDFVSAAPRDSLAPVVTVSSQASDNLTLSWPAIEGAEKYAIAIKEGYGYKTLSYDVVENEYLITGLAPGFYYEIIVQSYVGGRWSAFSDSDLVKVHFSDPSAPIASASAIGDGSVHLEWSAVEGAKKYAIAEKLGDGSYRTYTTECIATSYDVSDLSNGKKHSFIVQAFVGGHWSSYGDVYLVSATPHGVIAPVVSSEPGDHCVKLMWSPVAGASRYAIAVKTANGFTTYTYNHKGTSYTIRDLLGGTEYSFLVQAYIDGSWTAYSEPDLVRAVPTGTNETVLGVPRLKVVSWLLSHQYDGYYLGTPYSGGFSYPTCMYPNGDRRADGYSGMNCTGFVAHVFQSLGMNLNTVANCNSHSPWSGGPGGGGYINAWRWYGYAIDSGARVYEFRTVQDMLNSGIAQKGDIIFFKTDGSIDCHIGFFWGDNPYDNKMWHQIMPQNCISTCFNNANKAERNQYCVLIK